MVIESETCGDGCVHPHTLDGNCSIPALSIEEARLPAQGTHVAPATAEAAASLVDTSPEASVVYTSSVGHVHRARPANAQCPRFAQCCSSR